MKEARKENEKQFFDCMYERGERESLSKFYVVAQPSRKYYEDFLFTHCRHKKVLEYGCGSGSYAFFLERHGAKVTGIDISEVAIKQAQARAFETKKKDITFLLMDAEKMQFDDNYFDLVCGTGILHHIRLNKALGELTRVLNLEGKAIFIEPMGHNPAINLFRKLTPRLRTKDEHPLTLKDLKFMKEYFHQVNYRFFNLFSLLAIPFQNSKGFSSLLNMLDYLDRRLFEWIPWLKTLAWQVIIILERPKKRGFK